MDSFASGAPADAAALREIFSAFDRLEAAFNGAREQIAAGRRGYYTPDEDDGVRAMLLAYRNLRLALYDIIDRYRGFAGQAMDGEPRALLRGFVVGYAAALKLYSKSLRLIAATEDYELLRRKLNEPDSKFGLEAGFFEEVLLAFTSLANRLAMARAGWFWLSRRRQARRLGLEEDGEVGWLLPHIAADRKVLDRLFWRQVRSRLRRDWRSAWRRLFSPLQAARYGSQALAGFIVSGLRLPAPPPALDAEVLARLHPDLRPGDILLVRADDKVTCALLPGFWAHAALYLGSPEQLQALAGETTPAVDRALQAMAAAPSPLGWVLEAIPRGVGLTPLADCLAADHVAVLRPALPAPDLGRALAEALGHLGKPYDFEFDFNVSTRLVCTELVYRTYHGRGGIAFSLVKRLGRWTLTADDLVGQVLTALDSRPDAPLRPVVLWTRREGGTAEKVGVGEVVGRLLGG